MFSYEDAVINLESDLKSIDVRKSRVLPREKIEIEQQGNFRIMSAYIPDLKIVVTKSGFSVSQFRGNKTAAEAGETILLYDSQNGELNCIINSFSVNLMRTAAATALAAKYLANPDASTVGLYGTGIHSIAQLLGLHTVRKFDEVKVYSPTLQQQQRKKDEFIEHASNVFNASFKWCIEPRAVANSDIIVEATNSQGPVLRADWLYKAAHINSIGTASPGMRIIPDEVLRLCKVVCIPSIDEISARFMSADVNEPIANGTIEIKDICSLDEVVKGKKTRSNREDITIFKMIGTPVYDAIIANAIYRKGLKQSVGTKLLNDAY